MCIRDRFNSEEEELLIFDNDLQLIYDSEEREEKALNSLKDAVSIHDESGYWFRQKDVYKRQLRTRPQGLRYKMPLGIYLLL